MKHALILCSGGLDSITTAYYAKKRNPSSLTLLFCAYGQAQEQYERRAVKYHAHQLKAQYVEIALPALANLTQAQRKAIKKNENHLSDTKSESNQWFVPGRNTLLIAHALAYIESHYSRKEKMLLYLGFKNEGNDPFSDATKEYVKRMQKLLKQASKQTIILKTPFITKDKEEIIKKGIKLGINYTTTWSCYAPREQKQCGVCLACRLRKAGFKWANVQDPTFYAQ
jgi:7-cyano-7-deazaguanine synthase